MRLTKAWTAIYKLSIIWKSDLTDKMKRSFFQAAVVSICMHYLDALWMHYLDAKKTAGEKAWQQLHKNAASNIEQVLEATSHKAPTIRPPPITKTIQARRTRHAGHCWRSRDELISDVLQWTPSYGRAKTERPARTYIQQLCEDTGCSPTTCLRRWTIGRIGKRGSGISVLAARHDNDDDDILLQGQRII